MRGPKKQINYSQVRGNDEDSVMMVDEGAQFDGDSYRITHKSEKFTLRPSELQQSGGALSEEEQLQRDLQLIKEQEEKQFLADLERIREMEQKEQLQVDIEN